MGEPGGVVATLPPGAGLSEEARAFDRDEPAQQLKPLPEVPKPANMSANLEAANVVAERKTESEIAAPIVSPAAAQPSKARTANGKVKEAKDNKSKKPKADTAKAATTKAKAATPKVKAPKVMAPKPKKDKRAA